MNDLSKVIFGLQDNPWYFFIQVCFWGGAVTIAWYIGFWISVVARDFHKAGMERVRKCEERERYFKTGEF